MDLVNDDGNVNHIDYFNRHKDVNDNHNINNDHKIHGNNVFRKSLINLNL